MQHSDITNREIGTVAQPGLQPIGASFPAATRAPAPPAKQGATSRKGRMLASLRTMDVHVDRLITADIVPHQFISRFLAHIGWSLADVGDFVRARRAHLALELTNAANNKLTDQRIPRITHRIWVTNPNIPAMPPADYLEGIFSTQKTIPGSPVHMFWINNDEVARYVVAMAQAAGCACSVQNINQFAGTTSHELISSLINGRKFVLAADILKFVVLERFGGIYADLGVFYTNTIVELTETVDYCVLLAHGLFFQTSFVACAAHAPLASLFLAILDKPETYDRAFTLIGTTPVALDEVNIFAGPGFTSCALLFCPEAARLAILPPQSEFLTWRSQQSWYGDAGKFGNAIVGDTAATMMSDARFLACQDLLKESFINFGLPVMLREKIKILLPLSLNFEERPTRLCKIMHYHGSDKALGWHNYGYIYHHILSHLVGAGCKILEVGIGTNYAEMDSSMGINGSPGASLRGWREFLHNADIHGADIDTRVLFSEPGIKTHYVDQLEGASFEPLFRATGERRFDLIIDDGLHTFDANRNMLRNAYDHLTEGGIYIVEDIMNHDVPAWESFLAVAGLAAALITIPHTKNNNDNRIVVIQRK